MKQRASARDKLTLLLQASRDRGVRIDERRFFQTDLEDALHVVRKELRSLEKQLQTCEEMARVER